MFTGDWRDPRKIVVYAYMFWSSLLSLQACTSSAPQVCMAAKRCRWLRSLRTKTDWAAMEEEDVVKEEAATHGPGE